MNNKDKFIKEILQNDIQISKEANKVFEKFKEEIKVKKNNDLNNTNDKKIIKISLSKFTAIAASFVIVLFLGTNLYAYTKGYNNIFTTIGNIFNVNQKNYEMSENEINQTVESNGVKLTLKTVAMDDNVLIVKYVAEGEILKDKIITFESLTELVEKEESIKEQWRRGEGKEFNTTDVMRIKKEIETVINEMNYYGDKSILLAKTKVAYQQLIKSNYGDEGYTVEKAQALLNEAQALYEANIEKKNIINSTDKIEDISIYSIEQNVIKKDNKYEICVLYVIDTISELSNSFNINMNVNKIGDIEGKWGYVASLNKTKLNTRVETIDLTNYKAVISENITVQVKKLVISDFSSVLMLQTANVNDNTNNFADVNTIIPFTYLVTDEDGNIIGKGSQKQREMQKIKRNEVENIVFPNKYTDRIILKNVDFNIKGLLVSIYSNVDNQLLKTIKIDIENTKKSPEIKLEGTYSNDERKIIFEYPKDWILNENLEYISVSSPENVDGDKSLIVFTRENNTNKKTAKELKTESIQNAQVISEGEIKVNGMEAYYYEWKYRTQNYTVFLLKDNYVYSINYEGTSEVEYKKNFDTFKKILKTVEIQDEKLNNNNDIVYTAFETTVKGSKIQIPAINLNNKTVIGLNEELYNYGQSKAEQLEKGGISNDITYKYYSNENIVSLVIRTLFLESGEFNSYKVYNINKETGKIVSNKEIIDISGIDNYESKAQGAFQNKVYELYGKIPEGEEFNLSYEKTMVSANYDILNNTPIFLDENGDLNAIGKIYCPAGPEYLEYIINIENYTKFERKPEKVEEDVTERITENNNEVIKEEKTDLEKVREIEETLDYKICKNGPTLLNYIWIDIPENVTLSQGGGDEKLYGQSIWTNLDTKSRIKVYNPVVKAYNATSESVSLEIVEKVSNYLRTEVKIIRDQEWYLVYYLDNKDKTTYYMTTTKAESAYKIKVEYSNSDEESKEMIDKMVSSIAIPMG